MCVPEPVAIVEPVLINAESVLIFSATKRTARHIILIHIHVNNSNNNNTNSVPARGSLGSLLRENTG